MRPRTLDDFKGVSRTSGSQINFRECPVCGSEGWKVYVNPETGKWFCHAGGHGGGGQIEIGTPSHVNQTQATLLDMLANHRKRPRSVKEWPELFMPPFTKLTERAYRYLRNRGLSDASIRYCGIVEEATRYRILIPYFDDSGRLIYYSGRRYSENLGNGPKYMTAYGKHPLYVPRWNVLNDKIVLVEGAFDAIAVTQHTDCMAVAMGGKSLPRYLRKDLQKVAERVTIEVGMRPRLYIMLDSDATRAALFMKDGLPPMKLQDINVVMIRNGHDPASLPPDELRSVLNEGP